MVATFSIEEAKAVIEMWASFVAFQGKLAPVVAAHAANYGVYATLSDLVAAVRPLLAAEDLAFYQTKAPVDAGENVLRTFIVHASGASFYADTLPATLGRAGGPQQVRGMTTYKRREGLELACGISVTDDAADDDGDRMQEQHQAEEPKQDGSLPSEVDGAKMANVANRVVDWIHQDAMERDDGAMYEVLRKLNDSEKFWLWARKDPLDAAGKKKLLSTKHKQQIHELMERERVRRAVKDEDSVMDGQAAEAMERDNG